MKNVGTMPAEVPEDVPGKVELEVCCADIASLWQARGLVDRVELCAEISGGGISPSPAMVAQAVRLGFGSVNVLVRPRSGDFLFSHAEIDAMRYDIGNYRRIGATGVVVGALDEEGRLDSVVMPELAALAGELGLEAVCNRAIDLSPDPVAELERLIGWGFDRVLTSGGVPTAPEGMETLARMVEMAAGRITVMAGSGIRPDNVRQLVACTGVTAVHSTCHDPLLQYTPAPGFGHMSSPYTSRAVVKLLRDTIIF